MSKRPRGRPPFPDILTPAEWKVLFSAQHGLSKRVIARRLQVGEEAVKYHLRNIRDKLGISTKQELMQVFLVPEGSELQQLKKTQTGEKAMLTTGSHSIGQISRTVSNLEQSSNWFEVVLELPLLHAFGTMAFFDCNGTRLMLTTDAPLNQQESILYFREADIAARYRDLQAKGVEFLAAPHMIHRHEDGTEEWMSFFKDPDGRPLALMATVQASSS